MTGYVNSIQSLGAVDGPGIRFVVFLQGCNLRCGFCHNPDTWERCAGKTMTAEEIVAKAERYKEYFGKEGGITVSGGEPLLQAEFVTEIFTLCHQKGINTCLDTSGSIFNPAVEALLAVTDRVLLDIKYTNDEDYKKHAGCSYDAVLEFLSYLDKNKIPVTLRQVVLPTINDNEDNVKSLRRIADEHKCVDKTELLPFKKLCSMKYEKLGIDFPFASIPEPDKATMENLNSILHA